MSLAGLQHILATDVAPLRAIWESEAFTASLVAVVVALLGFIASRLKLHKAESDIQAKKTEEKLAKIDKQVSNSHRTNLRDDLDAKFDKLYTENEKLFSENQQLFKENAQMAERLSMITTALRQQGDRLTGFQTTANGLTQQMENVRQNAEKEHDRLQEGQDALADKLGELKAKIDDTGLLD